MNAPEASIRNVRKEKIEQIVGRLGDLLKRVYTYDEREKTLEQLNLDITLMCLKSNFLERRIHGIKSLGEFLKGLKYSNRNKLTGDYMLEWLEKNKILELIFDPKEYHVQIIQRSKEILRFLIVEDKLSEEQLNLFWRGTEFDDETRREIYKIIEECSSPMKEHHVKQFLDKFIAEKNAKIIPEAVVCIYEMGKFTKEDATENSLAVGELLWRFATDVKNPSEVTNSAITKLGDLLKKWKFSTAKPYFYKCLDNLKTHNASIESLKILKRIFREVEYVITYFKERKSDDEDDKELEEDLEKREDDEIVSPNSCILHFINEENIIEVLLENLKTYSNFTQGQIEKVKDKAKISEHMFEGRYDHKTNITERLEFLKFLASYSNFTISRKQVDYIWSCLVDESTISYDEEALFKWLKESCEGSSSNNVWELEDIGSIFNERFSKGTGEMGSLTLDGFYCIQSYFLLANETNQKLKRYTKPKTSSSSATGFSNSTGAAYSTFSFSKLRKQSEDTEPEQTFRVYVEPKDLDGINNIWKIAVECHHEEVSPKAIKFLIQLYYNLASNIEEDKRSVNNECLDTALTHLKIIQDNANISEETKSRQIISVLKIFEEFLAQSERKGTTGLKQQRSLLKGELLNKISISNSVSYNKLIGRKIELSLYSNSTVYDIKRIIGAVNKVPAEYVRLIRYSNTSEIMDIDNGKTLAELNFKPNENLIANKQNLGNIPKAPLMNPDKSLTKEAISIFGEWFDSFSVEGLMTPEDCVEFIRSCTDDKCKTSDNRVRNLFTNHDYDNDGKVDKAGFVEFYRLACLKKEDVVRSNILAHNYRNDLKKISDMTEENTDKTLLPRFILSHDPKYFDSLFSLLDRPDDSSKEAWELIQKLVTNPTIQTNVLNLNVERNENGEYNWDSLIDTKSIFKLLYMFQIIESLIEEGGENQTEICKVYKNKEQTKDAKESSPEKVNKKPGENDEDDDKAKEKEKETDSENRPLEYLVSELLASNQNDREEALKHQSETQDLRKTWIFRFLEKKGFEFSYDLFSKNKTDTRNMNSFQKNFLGFLLKILRIFITSAFLAVEPEVASLVALAKKKSSIRQNPPTDNDDTYGGSDNEENIYSTPKTKKGISRTITVDERGQILDFSSDTQNPGIVTEDYLFNDYNDIDSDRATEGGDDEIILRKRASSISTKQQVDPVERKIEQLASQLKGEIGDKMLHVIDFDQLQIIVLQSIASLIEKDEIDFDEKKIIENSLSLWLGCVLHKPKILDNFFIFKCNEFENVQDLMLRGILYPSLFRIREDFLHNLFFFATKVTNASKDTFEYTLKAMLQKLPKDNEGVEACTAQYFELVSKLIEEYFARVKAGKANREILDATKFFSEVIDKIKSHQSREVRNSMKQDETLIGYLKIAHMVLDRGGLGECVKIAINGGFITELFQRCLFPNNLSASNDDVTEGTDLASSLLVGNKCKTEESRKWAYKLLWTLCNNSLTLLNELIEKQMSPLCKQIRLHPGWLYTPSGDTRKGKYSGIRNLGCICYMNSMLQQLYHIPGFRYQLLQADDGAAPDWQEYKGRTIDDNVLRQLQRLFGHLELSERVDYNPIEFCFSFKQMDGTPTNTSIQHDSEEFFNIIFDRIENLMKPTPQKYLLQSTFGGKNCSQMVCKECGFIRNRFEDFYNLSLTVKERKSVEESLRKNLEGEIISDYECPGCKKKVDITKRTLISKTPNVFVIQLQRIVFDFDTFQNQKVNSHFEFPETLDLTPYSMNHIMKAEGKITDKTLGKGKTEGESDHEEEDEYEGMTEEEKNERIEEKETFEYHARHNETECYEYKLVGVVIHVGTADAGHYYSYINTDRFQKENEHDEEWADTSKDKWMEFNDSRVSDYNFDDLKADAFGGSSGSDDWFGGIFKSSSYGKSAYVLVYEKRFKNAIKILIPEVKTEATEGQIEEEKINFKPKAPQVIPEGAVIKTDPKNNERYYEIPMNKIKMFIPNTIYKEIWEDNLEFSFEKLIYSKEFYEFVKELMVGTIGFKERIASLPENERGEVDNVIANMTTVGNKIAYEVLVKAYHNYKLGDVADTLIRLYDASDQAVLNTMHYILKDENEDSLLYVFQVLLTCNDKISRNNTAKLVSSLVNRCFEIEKDILDETEKVTITVREDLISTGPNEDNEKTIEKEVIRPKSLAVRFYDLAIQTMKEKGPSNWSKFDQLLTMIRNIVTGGENQLNMVMKREGLIGFIDFMLGQNSPNIQPGERRTKMGSVYATPNFAPLLEALACMILRCYTPKFNKDSEDKPETFNKDASQHYTLTEADIVTYLLHEEFLKLAILNSSEALGNALSHICYRNLEVSKIIGKVILKTINTSDYEKIQQCMIVAKPYLYIKDEFQRNRCEWILGFSCLSTSSFKSAHAVCLPRFGVSIAHGVNDEVYQYMSPLDLIRGDHALLALLWRYRGKMDLYVVNCLNILLEIIVGNDFLLKYMFDLDPPTYEFARFTDWFRPYLEKELQKAHRSMSSYSRSNKKEESIVKCFSFLEIYEQSLINYHKELEGVSDTEELKASEEAKVEAQPQDDTTEVKQLQVIKSIPTRYIINCVTKMEELHKEERDGFVVTVSKLYCEYAESQPTLDGNKTLTSWAFHNARAEADTHDDKYYRSVIADSGEDERGESLLADKDNEDQEPVSKITIKSKFDYDGEGEDNKETSDWNLPKKETDFILIANVENNNTKSYTFRMRLICDDELSRSNIKTPTNVIESATKPMFNDIWMCVHKVDPEKDWGKFSFEWSFDEKQPESARRQNVEMSSVDRDIDTYAQMMYGPTLNMNYYGI